MITALDHIAIAVPDLEKSINRFMEDFDLEFKGTEEVAAAKTLTAFFPVPATSIELVHPINGEVCESTASVNCRRVRSAGWVSKVVSAAGTRPGIRSRSAMA